MGPPDESSSSATPYWFGGSPLGDATVGVDTLAGWHWLGRHLKAQGPPHLQVAVLGVALLRWWGGFRRRGPRRLGSTATYLAADGWVGECCWPARKSGTNIYRFAEWHHRARTKRLCVNPHHSHAAFRTRARGATDASRCARLRGSRPSARRPAQPRAAECNKCTGSGAPQVDRKTSGWPAKPVFPKLQSRWPRILHPASREQQVGILDGVRLRTTSERVLRGATCAGRANQAG